MIGRSFRRRHAATVILGPRPGMVRQHRKQARMGASVKSKKALLSLRYPDRFFDDGRVVFWNLSI